MSEYYNVVPWRNCKEWKNVYENIFSPNISNCHNEEALKRLLIWKARCPFLPSGIESTLSLLQVLIQDTTKSDANNEQIIRLAYSTAIMRFVNHMLDSKTGKGSSLYRAANDRGVPDWVIDLRHDAAHGNSLPSFELLKEATIICLKWLKTNYWDKHKDLVNDYVIQKKTLLDNDEEITSLMNMYISLSICAHSKFNLKRLSDISDTQMRISIVNDIRNLFNEAFDLSDLKTVSIKSVINFLNVHSKGVFKSENSIRSVNKALLGKDSLFLSTELLNFFNGSHSKNITSLSKHYIHCFEILLTFLHMNDILQEFILELIKITQRCDENRTKRRLAAMWISEIFKALKRSTQFLRKMRNQSDTLEKKSQKQLRALFFHWFPNEKDCNLLLDLSKPVPKDLRNIEFVQPIISTYNEYLTYFVEDLLNVIKPEMPSVTVSRICELAKLLAFPQTFKSNLVTSEIFTVDDIKKATKEQEQDIILDVDGVAAANKNVENDSRTNNFEQQTFGLWQLVSSDYDWTNCPIGAVPWDCARSTQETESNTYAEPMDIDVN